MTIKSCCRLIFDVRVSSNTNLNKENSVKNTHNPGPLPITYELKRR